MEETEVRRSTDRRRFTGLGSRLRETGAANRLVRLAWKLPAPVAIRIIGALKRPFSKPIERPELGPEIYEQLRERFAPEADWLRRYTGDEFADWSC